MSLVCDGVCHVLPVALVLDMLTLSEQGEHDGRPREAPGVFSGLGMESYKRERLPLKGVGEGRVAGVIGLWGVPGVCVSIEVTQALEFLPHQPLKLFFGESPWLIKARHKGLELGGRRVLCFKDEVRERVGEFPGMKGGTQGLEVYDRGAGVAEWRLGAKVWERRIFNQSDEVVWGLLRSQDVGEWPD